MRQLISEEGGLDAALAFLEDAYSTCLERADRTPEHPILVALLLAQDDQETAIVVTGLLHDALEDTNVGASELRASFGSDIARVVEALSEDPSITKNRKRKAALRQQVLDSGPEAAAVSLADKIAN